MSNNNPIFVATHPRACSTAFERVFMTQRKTLQTIHEPFGDAFYYGPERMGARFETDEKARETSGFAQSTFKTILDRIEREAAEGKRVFIKDMAYYLVPPEDQAPCVAPSLMNVKRGVGTEAQLNQQGGLGLEGLNGVDSPQDSAVNLDSPPKSPPFPYETRSEPKNPTIVPREILERFHFTFLIRHPNRSIPSYYRCCVPPLVERSGFHKFNPSEAGYDELKKFFDYCKDTGLTGPKICDRPDTETSTGAYSEKPTGVEICVIDADDLLDDPEGILRKFCKSIDVPFTPDMLNWNNDEDQEFAQEAFAKWDGWHDDAINSKDLKPRAHKQKPKSTDEFYAEWVDKYGQEGADVIRRTAEANVEAYEYLKGFAIRA
ncbi:hypothetical protein B0A50_04707 [Salinomyces thailandicus]|uniref:P-loop containing nucleoside triphosphate hydrolase protein n=1 Tax=Salinomyces thailandicus TaxID=706561 RepID=A0A4V5N470_9PEZI|nr:hypothetical protein B0A50_04707 [Salinomyces thailandica]